MVSKRNYGIDLLRIICMYFIVNLHVVSHGGLMKFVVPLSIDNLFLSIIKICSICAVNCYGIITGYVYANIKWKLKNIINLYLQVLFYSIVFVIIFKLIYASNFSFSDIQHFFPVLTYKYWYFTSYVGLFFLIPFLNKFFNKVSCNVLKNLIVISFILFSILELVGIGDIFSIKNGYSCWWLINLYLLGFYIKKYCACNDKNKYKCLYLIIMVLLLFARFLLLFLSDIAIFKGKEDFLLSYSSPFIFFMAFSLIMIFKDLKIKSNIIKIINYVVPYSFGVYLIHDNMLVRSMLISNKFVGLLNSNTLLLFLSVLFISFIIFIVCIIIDFFRQCIFKILKVSKIVDFLNSMMNKIFNRTSKLFSFLIE